MTHSYPTPRCSNLRETIMQVMHTGDELVVLRRDRLGRSTLDVLYEETGDEDLSLGGGHPDAQAGGLGRNVRRDHYPPSPVMANQDERRLSRRRPVSSLPAPAICHPCVQEQRDNLRNRTAPVRNHNSLQPT